MHTALLTILVAAGVAQPQPAVAAETCGRLVSRASGPHEVGREARGLDGDHCDPRQAARGPWPVSSPACSDCRVHGQLIRPAIRAYRYPPRADYYLRPYHYRRMFDYPWGGYPWGRLTRMSAYSGAR